MMTASDALGVGVQVGKIFSLPVADGAAYYKVTRVNKLTARAKWVKELSVDGWQDMRLGEEGSIEISIIGPMMDYDKRLREIMGKK